MSQERIDKLTLEVKKYKEILDKKKNEEQRLLGHRDALLLKLKEMGYPTAEEAEKALEELSNTIDEMVDDLEKKKKEFLHTYGEHLR